MPPVSSQHCIKSGSYSFTTRPHTTDECGHCCWIKGVFLLRLPYRSAIPQKASAAQLSKRLLIYGDPTALHPYATASRLSAHYTDVIMGTMTSQIISLTIVYSTIYSGADRRKHQSSASLAFVWGIHRWPVNSPHKGPVTRKIFPFDDVIMKTPHPLVEVPLKWIRHTECQ